MTVEHTLPKLTRIGPYQLVAKLGETATATVHLAKTSGPEGVKKLVIVKALRAEVASASETFSAEMQLATRLTHPNIVHTYGAVEGHRRLYFATEYIDGQPWSRIRRALWQQDSLPEALHLKLLLEVLSGLHYAHELRDEDDKPLQIVHGDVSPHNVIVTYDGLVKLVDFGVARAVQGHTQIRSKRDYRAPEQVRGEASDRRADIFAVGVMLWEAMTRRPFVQSQDASEVRSTRTSGLEPRVRALVPDAPPALADICDRALALPPEERFATAAELRAALLAYLGEDMQDSDRARLAELVQGAFQKERASSQTLVAQQLRPAEVRDHQAIARKLAIAAAARTQRMNSPEATSAAVIPKHWPLRLLKQVSLRDLRRGPLPLLVIGVGALSFGITWLVARPEPQVAAPAVHGELREPVQPSAPEELRRTSDQPPERETRVNASTDADRVAPPSLVHLTITARPASAVLLLDGVPLSDNPFSASVAADHQLHTIRASAAGVTAQERTVRFDRDHALTLELEPQVTHPVTPAPRSARKTQAASVDPQPSAATSAGEANGGARQRTRASDMFDAPLRVGKAPRPIYEDDPYGR